MIINKGATLKARQIPFKFKFAHMGSVEVPFDFFVFDKLGEYMIPQYFFDKFAFFGFKDCGIKVARQIGYPMCLSFGEVSFQRYPPQREQPIHIFFLYLPVLRPA